MRLWLLLPLIGISISCSAAPFRNLGFDEAITNNVQLLLPRDPLQLGAGLGPPGELVPGWDLFLGLSTPVASVGYNLLGPRSGAPDNYFSIISRDANPNVEGLYFLEIFRPTFGLRLSQKGDVPVNAKFLRFRAFGSIAVEVNGDLFIPAFDSTQNIASVDVSKYAGQNVRITFTAPGGLGVIDSIVFVIEPPSIQQEGTNIIVSWKSDRSIRLASSLSVIGPWQSVSNAVSPYALPKNSANMMFFRLSSQP